MVTVDNIAGDVFIREQRLIQGTTVGFSTSRQTRRELEKVFQKFTSSNYEFDKNSVRIKLSAYDGLLSRSQAKRMLVGLDDFSHLDFNFAGVKEIGQAFADEIFRVYARNNLEKILSYSEAEAPVAYMIERARKYEIKSPKV